MKFAQKVADLKSKVLAQLPEFVEHDTTLYFQDTGADMKVWDLREDMTNEVASVAVLAGMSGAFQIVQVMGLDDAAILLGLLKPDQDDFEGLYDALGDTQQVEVPPGSEPYCDRPTYVLVLTPGA